MVKSTSKKTKVEWTTYYKNSREYMNSLPNIVKDCKDFDIDVYEYINGEYKLIFYF